MSVILAEVKLYCISVLVNNSIVNRRTLETKPGKHGRDVASTLKCRDDAKMKKKIVPQRRYSALHQKGVWL